MQRNNLLLGIVLGGLAVVTGALGAHALSPILLENNRVDTFELAVRYQFYHALTLLVIGVLGGQFSSGLLSWSGILITAGVIVFSGSLYMVALSGTTVWGAVTPFGGLFLMGGWVCFALAVVQKKQWVNSNT